MTTPKGVRFAKNELRTVAEIDLNEGLLELLRLALSSSSREEILTKWRNFVASTSTYKSESSIRNTLAHRLDNLAARGLVTTKRRSVSPTDEGRRYLSRAALTTS